MFDNIIKFVRSLYGEGFIPLHEPRFIGNERKYLLDCIDSTFVSSVGEYVSRFEQKIAEFTGTKFAVATMNGSAALHIALLLSGVKPDNEVLTQPLTFVATCNAISYCDAKPLFIDVDVDTLGLSPEKLAEFLETETLIKDDGFCFNKKTGRKISACVPMHTFGHPARIDEIAEICEKHNIRLIEDASESLGSTYKGKHTGTFGQAGVLSLNGNKTITSGGDGAILTDDEDFAKRAKHITTTAKIPHAWDYVHDEIAYNYRLPNINSALACAQLEMLDDFINNKRATALKYKEFFAGTDFEFIDEPVNSRSNFWLCTIKLQNSDIRNAFLEETNRNGVMTRPVWRLMNKLEMYNQ
ncbi:MAG: LegC family aminotransferase, partial [Planctomycetes bacterium]|nr:LegC family aminotransferase [Planctomycetota bacterium]